MSPGQGTFDASTLRELVRDDRVHRRVYTDPDVFALEMDRLWGYAWIYVGHESQVPKQKEDQQKFIHSDFSGISNGERAGRNHTSEQEPAPTIDVSNADHPGQR